MRVVQALAARVRRAAAHNSRASVPPACILWPDGERQWEAVLARLRDELPELAALGPYRPGERTGPAIWLRCFIAGKAEGACLEEGVIPILYLPGVSRRELRAVEQCPESLRPLVELQYRGSYWSQANGKDWTPPAFLVSPQGGLGMDVAQDGATRKAVRRALHLLLDEDVEGLRGRRLDGDFFNALLTGADVVRVLLEWLDQGEDFRAARSQEEWGAFVDTCTSVFGYHPANDGHLAGVERLAHGGTAGWDQVWARFCEAPRRYPRIPARIRALALPSDLFADFSRWPQYNDRQEDDLRKCLEEVAKLPLAEACRRIQSVDDHHALRRSWVWAELGHAPLAKALGHLRRLAEVTGAGYPLSDLAQAAGAYLEHGWEADRALVAALEEVKAAADVNAVHGAARALYLPWVEDLARRLQDIVVREGYPRPSPRPLEAGECVLFVDGLRLDVARRLRSTLESMGFTVREHPVWAAVPTVTATGKPAISPAAPLLSGKVAEADFAPVLTDQGKTYKDDYALKKGLAASGVRVLKDSLECQGDDRGWREFGDLDHLGHRCGWKLAQKLGPLVEEIAEQVRGLLLAGWESVRVVTDHGWLLVPGGLPKVELGAALVEAKAARFALPKLGAPVSGIQLPWHWEPSVFFVSAPGASCYQAGEEFAHGGVSLQECLTLELSVTARGVRAEAPLRILQVLWKKLRCTVLLCGEREHVHLDIRTQPGNPATSIAHKVNAFRDDGTASVVVADERQEGAQAFVVVLDDSNQVLAQAGTVVGGGAE